MRTLIIIPAYNEEACIKRVIESVYNANKNVDVLVVNDGSSDGTSGEVKKTKAICIDLPINLGIGGAVQTGYIYAYENNYDIAIQLDGDGQHDPKYIAQMVDIIEKEKVDMVIGSRFIENTGFKQSFMRALGNKILSFEIKLFGKKKIYDTTSGFRAVSKDIIKYFANKYPCDYPEPDTNLKLILNNKKVKEIPVVMYPRTTGKSFVSPYKSAKYMIKVSLALIISTLRKEN